MPARKITTDGIAINKRFFEVIDMIIAQKRMRGLQTFTREHDLNFGNMCTIKNNPEGHVIKTEWIAYLVNDFDVCADYILLGTGPMFRREIPLPQPKPRKKVGRPRKMPHPEGHGSETVAGDSV
jgi:hypothetical protein